MRVSPTARALLLPLLLAVLNPFLWGALAEQLPAAEAVFNSARAVLFFWAGWRMVAIARKGAGAAAVSGALLFFVDHVVLKGGAFLIHALAAREPERHQHFLAFAGVFFSYLMFVSLAAALGALGAIAARIYARRAAVAA